MSIINFVHPVTNEKHTISVTMSVPYPALTLAIEDFLDSLPAEKSADYGRPVISAVNSAMKQNAVEKVVYSADVFATMDSGVTFGKYTIEAGESGGYALGSATIADKEVKVYNKESKKSEKVRRPAFVTYADCVRYVKALNRENKKEGRDIFTMGGDFTADELRKIRYEILASDNRLSDKDVENLKARAEKDSEYNAFLAGNSNEAKKARVAVIYGMFNRRTGKNVPAIHHVENNVVRECTSYNSMYKVEGSANEAVYISAFFNEYHNSALATAFNHRAKKPEAVGKKKKQKPAEAEKPAEAVEA